METTCVGTYMFHVSAKLILFFRFGKKDNFHVISSTLLREVAAEVS